MDKQVRPSCEVDKLFGKVVGRKWNYYYGRLVCYKPVNMDEEQEAKLKFIEAYFDDVEAKLAFLSELAATGHKDEAMTLCLVYIDRLAQGLQWPSTSISRNFVDALIRFGQNPVMGLHHPLQAARAFAHINKLKTLGTQIIFAFPGPAYKLMELQNFEAGIAKAVPGFDRSALRKEAWRATIANVAYQRLRIPAVHGSGVSGALDFSLTTYNDNPIPILDMWTLRTCAFGLLAEARHRSEAKVQWFGNDEIVNGSI